MVAEMELAIEIIEGPQAGRLVPLERDLSIGRSDDSDVTLDDDLVSRKHAVISVTDDGAWIKDVGSLNGTFINNNQIHSPTKLMPGDHLVIGVNVLEVRTAGAVAHRPSAVRTIPPPLAALERPPDYMPDDLRGDPAIAKVESLLDAKTKDKARGAPLAIFVLVVIVVIVFLAVR
ncbi:MAG: hypothetical protein QOC87_776 [Actinomycetota bacterium]|nr:hypothetical protein [Actinomycetota bacterium]